MEGDEYIKYLGSPKLGWRRWKGKAICGGVVVVKVEVVR
jgi:hypothetical protein